MPFSNFGTAKVKRSVAICANCGEPVPLTFNNHSWGGPYYVCGTCKNVVAVYYGNRIATPERVLRVDWAPEMTARSEKFDRWQWAICRTKENSSWRRVLFLLAEEEEKSFVYGDEREHRTVIFFDDQQNLSYLFWSENRGRSGKREPALRQLFVRKEFRRQGIGTAMVQLWADRFAFPLADSFGVESPNAHTQEMLVRLGYAQISAENIVGTKCYFVPGM